MNGLQGKTAIVTGGSSGIGQAIAVRLGQEGVNVAILVNRARTRGERESRTKQFSSLAAVGTDEPAVDPDRFVPDGRWAGFWTAPPSADRLPEPGVLATELGERLSAVIAALPPAQRTVLELRDVQGMTSTDVCELLDISEANQRVLLHRARSRARAALEPDLTAGVA